MDTTFTVKERDYMPVRSTRIDSNDFGVISVGQIEPYWYAGVLKGAVLSQDSLDCDVMDFGDAYVKAAMLAEASDYSEALIVNCINFLNTSQTSEEAFYEYIQYLNNHMYWFWGNCEKGGVYCYKATSQEYADKVVVGACQGCYTITQDNTQYYRYFIGGGMTPYRTYREMCKSFIAFRWDSEGVGFISLKETEDHLYADTITRTYDLEIMNYRDTLIGPYLAPINETRSILPPDMIREVCLVLDDSNSYCSLSGFDSWHDNLYYSGIEGWHVVHGIWTGGEGVAPQPPYDPSKEQGGTDDYNEREDDTGYTDESQFEVDGVNAGLVTIFNPSQREIREFSRFLFSGITEDIAAFFKRLMSNPLDYVISLAQVHYKPECQNAAEIKFGGIGSGVASMIVKDQYYILNCGSVPIQREWGSFLDYGGYTKCRLYLPYCGIHDIDVDLIQDAMMSIQYIIDNLSGACVAQVILSHTRRYDDDRNIEGTRYEFTGNVFENLPLSAADYRSAINGVLTAMGGVGAIASGNPVSGAAAIASGVISMKPTIQTASKVGSNFGYMGLQKPFIEIIRPNPSVPLNKPYREGYPANIFIKKLSSLSGYTEIEKGTFMPTEIHYATDEEVAEITNLLESGVIL